MRAARGRRDCVAIARVSCANPNLSMLVIAVVGYYMVYADGWNRTLAKRVALHRCFSAAYGCCYLATDDEERHSNVCFL